MAKKPAAAVGCSGFAIIAVIAIFAALMIGNTTAPNHAFSSGDPPSAPTTLPATQEPGSASAANDDGDGDASTMRRAGTLVRGDGVQWNAARQDERIAAVTVMVNGWGDDRGWSRSERLSAGAYLLGCLNSFYEGGSMNSQHVADIAASCEVIRENGQQ